jgi:hypothetical protein
VLLDSIFARKIYALQAFSTFFALNFLPQNEPILLNLNNVFTLAAIGLFADRRFDEKCKNQV